MELNRNTGVISWKARREAKGKFMTLGGREGSNPSWSIIAVGAAMTVNRIFRRKVVKREAESHLKRSGCSRNQNRTTKHRSLAGAIPATHCFIFGGDMNKRREKKAMKKEVAKIQPKLNKLISELYKRIGSFQILSREPSQVELCKELFGEK